MATSKICGSFGELNYSIHPGGNNVLLAFHGFGQDHTALLPLIKVLTPAYTVYSFDHFFHGKSLWKLKDETLTKQLWSEIIQEFLTKHSIESFDLLGFSLGAKISLTTFELFSQHVKGLHLLAPDGIETNIWYNLATYPSILRRYFKSMIVQPHRFNSIMSGLNRLGLVDRGLMRFASSQMNTASKRHRVYYSWMVYKRFQLSNRELIEKLNNTGCSVNFWLGKYDRIIREQGIRNFITKLTNGSLKILDCGHTDLIKKVAEQLHN